MAPLDHKRFREVIGRLYAAVGELEAMFPGRHFTPDGHMVGSLGECLVADAYGLQLRTASNKGYDAVTTNGLQVEIKATQSSSVGFRSEPEHTIAIRILPDGDFEEIYNGPGVGIWAQFSGKPLPSNGQFQISVSKLRKLNAAVSETDRIARVR